MRVVFLAIVLAYGCSEPPRWSAEELRVEEVTGTRIAVAWPRAEGASAYVVRIDGRPAARLGPEARSYAADELEEASEHTIEVQALDDAGGSSTVLRASATTLDVTAPAFAEDARLEVSAEPPRGADELDAARDLVLRWPEARDNVAVARYRVLRGEEQVALVDAPETSARLRLALTPGAEERFAVRPIDAAGNEAERGLEGTYRDPRRLRDAVESPRRDSMWDPMIGAGVYEGTLSDVGPDPDVWRPGGIGLGLPGYGAAAGNDEDRSIGAIGPGQRRHLGELGAGPREPVAPSGPR